MNDELFTGRYYRVILDDGLPTVLNAKGEPVEYWFTVAEANERARRREAYLIEQETQTTLDLK